MPSHFQHGINTELDDAPLFEFGLPDPTKWLVYYNDFVNTTDIDITNNWTSTEAEGGAGDTVIALQDEIGGVVKVTNDAADNDATFLQLKTEMFLLSAGKKAFYKSRFKVSDATQSDFVIGLQVKDTTPLDVTDGIYFIKDDGDAQLDVICRKNATTGSNTKTNIHTIVDDTYLTVSWYYDGVDTLHYFVNDVRKGGLVATSAYLPDTEITISFGIQNGEAVAKTMSVDYIFAALER